VILAAIAELALLTAEGAPASVRTDAAKVTVVVFVSTVCPVSNDYRERYEALHRAFAGKGVQFAFVYSNKTETAADIRKHLREGGYPFPAYQDPGNVVADRLKARVTPVAVVLDGAGEVRYTGKIDDAVNPARVRQKYLDDAMRAVLAGRKVKTPATEPYG